MKRIYISDALHQHLKKEATKEGRTLQWVVEDRLTRGDLYTFENTPTPKNTSVKNLPDSMQESITCIKCGMTSYHKGDIANKYCGNCNEFHANMLNEKKSEATPLDPIDVKHVPDIRMLEQPCCTHPTRPCKHWVWDNQTGEGYVNTLSGRTREAE